jgi:hypothetical protein
MSKELIDRLRKCKHAPAMMLCHEAADTIEQLMCDTQEVNAARIYLREKEGLLRDLATSQKQNVILLGALDVLEEFADTVAPFSSFWEEVWPKHQEALAATADLEGLVLCEGEPVAWLWQRNYSNGGYTREVCQFEGKARELAEDGKNLPTPDSVTPLYRAREQK